jgi:prepilin-type N-terminal cleavage/methylation domain-containing protein
MKQYTKGFTAIEIVIVLAIVVLLIAVVLPPLEKMKQNQVLKSAVADISSTLNKAKSQTLSSVNSLEYGVHFQSDKIVIFQGNTYSAANSTNEDVQITYPAYISNINLTGGASDIYFDKLSGAPNKTGDITVSIPTQSKTVTISATGAVSSN